MQHEALLENEIYEAKEARRRMDLLDVYFAEREQEAITEFADAAGDKELLTAQIKLNEVKSLRRWLNELVNSGRLAQATIDADGN